jgi:hypothetical protein
LRGGQWRWAAAYPLDDQHINGLIDSVHTYLQQQMSLTVNVPLEQETEEGRTILDSLLRDPGVVLRNAWETSRGSDTYLGGRGLVEESMGYAATVRRSTAAGGIYVAAASHEPGPAPVFVPQDADRSLLPKYAALTSPLRRTGLRQYGAAVFHLSQAVRNRATFTPDDSFSNGPRGAAGVTGPGDLLPLLVHGSELLVRLAFAEATQFTYDPDYRKRRDTAGFETLGGYFEAQIHGDLSWSDLERVVLIYETFEKEKFEEIKTRLEEFAAAQGYGFQVEMRRRPIPGRPAPVAATGTHGVLSADVHETYPEIELVTSLLDEAGDVPPGLLGESSEAAETAQAPVGKSGSKSKGKQRATVQSTEQPVAGDGSKDKSKGKQRVPERPAGGVDTVIQASLDDAREELDRAEEALIAAERELMRLDSHYGNRDGAVDSAGEPAALSAARAVAEVEGAVREAAEARVRDLETQLGLHSQAVTQQSTPAPLVVPAAAVATTTATAEVPLAEESLLEVPALADAAYAHPHHAPSNRRAFTQRGTMPDPLPDSAVDWVLHLLEVSPPERVRALVAMGQDLRDDVFVDQDLNDLIMDSLLVDEYAHLTGASQDVAVVQDLIDGPAALRAQGLADVPLLQRVRILNTQPLVDLLASRLPAGEFDAVLSLLGVTDRHYATVAPDGAQGVMDRLLGESPAGRAQLLDNLKPENRRWLAVQPDFVDALREDLSLTEFVDVAARLLVHVDTRARHPAQTRAEARRRLGRLLQDGAGLTADRLLKAGVQLLVIPTDVAMTDLPPFRSYQGRRAQATGTGAGRQRNEQRGLQWGSFIAVGEENFLGLETPIGHELHAPDGYSIAEHEIAHAVHEFALTAEERGLVQDVYAQKMAMGDSAVWPDGKRLKVNGQWVDNYSAKNVFEFFSQISVTYLGTNFGTDPDTRQSRNNGPQWVEQNEPRLLPLLRRLYGPDPSRTYTKTNPVNELRAEEGVFAGFRRFMRDNDGIPARASRSWAEALATMDPAERAAEIGDMVVEDRAALHQDTGFADRLRELLPTHESSAFLRDLQGTVLTDLLLQGPVTFADLTADERALVSTPSNIERLEEGLPEDRFRTVKSYLTADNLVVKTPTQRAFLARSLNPLERAELLADPVFLGLLQQRVPEDEYRRFLEALDVPEEEADTASESESDESSLNDAPALRTTLNAPAALDVQSPHRFDQASAAQQELDDSLAESDAASVRSSDTDAIRVPSPFLLQGWDRATDHAGLVAFADEVHRRLDANDPRGALRVVERLERDLRRLWALEDVWEDRFGENLHQRLRTELVGDESLVDRVFGEPVRDSVSVDEVHVFYERLEELEFLHPVEGSLRLPHDHPETGCHLRAHEIALKLQQWGVRPHKVTVSGPGLGTMSENALHAFPGQPRHVQWDWHIATAVYTEDPQGNPGELIVLDPALARGPLSQDEWLRASGADPAQVRILRGDVEQIRATIDAEATSRPDLWTTVEETIHPLGRQVLLVTDAGMLDFNGSSPLGPTLRGVDDLLRLGEHANRILEHRREADDRRAYRALMEVMRAPASEQLDAEGRAERLRAVLDLGRVTGSLVHIHDFVTAGGGERSLLAAEALRSEINGPELGRDSFFPVLDAIDYATLRPGTGQPELAGPDAARSAALVVLAENAFEGSVDPQALAEATTVLWAFVGALLEADNNEGHLDELVRETLRMTTLIDELTARPVAEREPQGTDSPVEDTDVLSITRSGERTDVGDWQPPAQWRLPLQPLNSQRQFPFEELLTAHLPAEEARGLFNDLGTAGSTVAESADGRLQELGRLVAADIAERINAAGLLIAHTELRLELTDPLNAGVLATLTQVVANSLNHRMLMVLAPGTAVEVCPSLQLPAS